MSVAHQNYRLVPGYQRQQCSSQLRIPRVNAFFTEPQLYIPSPYISSSYSQPLGSPMFSAPASRAPDAAYPSPSPSIPSPGLHRIHQTEHNHSTMQSPNTSSDTTGSPFSQIESSIGPSRTRIRRVAFEHHQPKRGVSLVVPSFPLSEENHPDSGSQDEITSRADSPSRYDNVDVSANVSSPSAYHPVTPTSSSRYSPFDGEHPDSPRFFAPPAVDHHSASPPLSATSEIPSIEAAADHNHDGDASAKKSKKARLTNYDRKRICEYSIKYPGKRQEDIASQFKVERSTISKILKKKELYLNKNEDTNGVAKDRHSKYSILDPDLHAWVKQCDENNINISDAMIRIKAKEVARKFNIGDVFKASSGWVGGFKDRHAVKRGVWINGKRALGDYVPGVIVNQPVHPHISPPVFGEPLRLSNFAGDELESQPLAEAAEAVATDVQHHTHSSTSMQHYDSGGFAETSSYSADHRPLAHSDQDAVNSYHEVGGHTEPTQEEYMRPPVQEITSDDAERALDIVINYADVTKGSTFLTTAERQLLGDIKARFYRMDSGFMLRD